jgi:hypothetical protein
MMFRLSYFLLLILAICGITNAAPPTQQNWSDVLNRYSGTFNIVKDSSDEPAGAFQFKWTEPRKVSHYSFRSFGDEPAARMTGFCFWNDKENRAEFNEIEYGDEGRMAVNGYCVNSSENTMTWIVSFWTQDGMVRQIAMADTFTKDGIDRSVTLLSGRPLASTTVKWVRVK